MNHVFGPVALVLLTLAPLLANAAQVYKCVDPQTGNVAWSMTKCANGQQQTKVDTANPKPRASDSAAEKRLRETREELRPGDYAAQPDHARRPSETAGDPAMRQQLADECTRGFEQSCTALRAMNVQARKQGGNVVAGDQAQRDKLASECKRGFNKSCEALRTLSGETKTVCTSVGSQSGSYGYGAYNGVYSGRTVCRER